MSVTIHEKKHFCTGCGKLVMKTAAEPEVFNFDKSDEDKKKGCKTINVELKCKSRGCNTFNNFVLVA